MTQLKGQIGYDITLNQDGYIVVVNTTAEEELAALMMVREVVKYSKENLKSSLTQANGNHLKMIKDRLQKITTTEYTLTMMIESVIGEFLVDSGEEYQQQQFWKKDESAD